MDDPEVIKKLLNKYLIPPPKPKLRHIYRLANPRLNDTSMGQAEKIRNILKNKVSVYERMIRLFIFHYSQITVPQEICIEMLCKLYFTVSLYKYS